MNDDSDILFDTPIQFVKKIEIIYEKNDDNYYIVTLYMKTYTINFNKNTDIDYEENNERVELYSSQMILHSSTNEFTKATVHIFQPTDTLNKLMYTDIIDCDTCLGQLKNAYNTALMKINDVGGSKNHCKICRNIKYKTTN